MKPLHLLFPAQRTQLPEVAEAIHSFGCEAGWPETVCLQIDLALEELLVNIMDYGYPDRPPGQIELTLQASPDHLNITVADDGVPFNPWQYAAPNLEVPLEDRIIGGLGIHLVKSIMDSCTYSFFDSRNRVILTKSL
jgi:serine/threonine-protein kinase RsbW